jgi:cytochrome c oxidase subunit IV
MHHSARNSDIFIDYFLLWMQTFVLSNVMYLVKDKDLSYSLGWAYFVLEIAYRAHLKKYESEIVQSVGISPTVSCLFSL